jgi:hypothetical protein
MNCRMLGAQQRARGPMTRDARRTFGGCLHVIAIPYPNECGYLEYRRIKYRVEHTRFFSFLPTLIFRLALSAL